MITSHSWRPPLHGNRAVAPFADRPCEFMNCRRPRTAHTRAVAGKQVRR